MNAAVGERISVSDLGLLIMAYQLRHPETRPDDFNEEEVRKLLEGKKFGPINDACIEQGVGKCP